jgi:hypothetical protein
MIGGLPVPVPEFGLLEFRSWFFGSELCSACRPSESEPTTAVAMKSRREKLIYSPNWSVNDSNKKRATE